MHLVGGGRAAQPSMDIQSRSNIVHLLVDGIRMWFSVLRRLFRAVAPLPESVPSWLRGLELECYIEAFEKNGIVVDVLPLLSSDDLKEIGIRCVGERRRILAAVDELRGSRPPERKKRWIDSSAFLIACLALITSIVSAYQTREHDKLSVVPYISVGDNGSERKYRKGSPETFGIWISNNGAGVAKITSLTISSELVKTTDLNEVMRAVGLTSIPQLHWTELEQPYYLKEGTKISLLFVEEKEIAALSEDDRIALLKDLSAKAKLLKIRVAYESIYGDKSVATWPIDHGSTE
jgi:hypothetical protein